MLGDLETQTKLKCLFPNFSRGSNSDTIEILTFEKKSNQQIRLKINPGADLQSHLKTGRNFFFVFLYFRLN
jgi:hypothetical protein